MTRNALQSALIGGTAILSMVGLSACDQQMADAPESTELAAAAPADGQAVGEPEPGTNNEIVSEIEDTASAVVGAIDAELTETTQGFAEAMSLQIIYQIAAAETAIERSDMPQVTDFAESILAANQDAQSRLAEVVEASHIPIRMPDELGGRHQGMLDNLTGASDEDFEARFLEQQVTTHSEAQTLVGDYAGGGRSPPIRDFAAEILPQIEQRLARAEALNAELAEDEEG